ncbi:MAG: M61 family metallopeptidase [Gemmatimonadaceae bacterium]
MRLALPSLAILVPALVLAQRMEPVRYDVSFPNAVHHEASITAEFTAVRAGTLILRMSRSSPGRYALHEFAKNVYGVRAVDGAGRALRVSRPNPHQWNVATSGGTVRVSYTLFGDRVDGTYAGISEAHAHLNMPATFMWARGFETRPIRVTFHPRPGWRIATQLAVTPDSLSFTAPHLQYFMDSPTMLGPLAVRTWTATSQGRIAQFRVALDHLGTDAELDTYVDGAKRIVREAEGVWGELPAFDFGQYTFLAAYLPWASGDGMEHRNSTSLTSSASLSNRMTGLLGTVSHEFFHAWNVERFRPRSIEPFNFSDANPSPDLWLAEGFTSYYGDLIMARAELVAAPDFVRSVGATADGVVHAPGRRWFSAAEMSEQAPMVDAAVSVDPTNRANTFISYYSWGEAIALGLDLSLRARHDTLSLDTFMRALWSEFGRAQTNFAPAKPYRADDVRRVLGRVAGDTAWANNFFARYVTGRDVPDYAALAARAGIVVRRAHPGAAWIGDTQFWNDGGRVSVESPVRQGTPLYDVGIEMGDHLAQFDGAPITRAAQVDSIVGAHRPGDRIPMVFIGRSGARQVVLTLAENSHLEFVPGEAAGQPPTPAQLAFRQRWLAPVRKN